MFNRTYQIRARRQGRESIKVDRRREASNKIDRDPEALLRLPWAGLFEPWRPFAALVAAAVAAEKAGPEYLPPSARKAFRRRPPARRRPAQLKLFDDKLRGVQLAFHFERSPAPQLLPAELYPTSAVKQEVPLTEDELAAEFEKL